jgi:aspartate/methionine/tyrosine aminotransferase
MRLKFSRTALRLHPSATAKINDRILEKNLTGAGIINFTVGQPNFSLSERVLVAANDLLKKSGGANKYPPTAGVPILREQIATRANQVFIGSKKNKQGQCLDYGWRS